jgi:putative acetyltransferase
VAGPSPVLVDWAAEHTAAIVDLIGAVFAEYRMTFDPAGYDADLRDIYRHYLQPGGWFGVLLEGGRLVGTVAVKPTGATMCEVKRLYLHPDSRGQGHGRALLEHALRWADERGYRMAVAWSDERLPEAHRLYRRLGFEQFSERVCDDIDRSHEYGFRRASACP